MAVWTFADAFQTTLSAGISAGATSFTPVSTAGQPGADNTLPIPTQFAVVLQSAGYPGLGTREIVTVTASTATPWTCTATANAYSSGDIVAGVITNAGMLGVQRTAATRLTMPTGGIAANFDRTLSTTTPSAAFASGTLVLVAVGLVAGDVINHVNVRQGSTGMTAGTHAWGGLFDANRVGLAITSDDTTGSWTASTSRPFNFAAPYTVPSTGMYYVGVCIVSGSIGTYICCSGSNAGLIGITPISAGTSSTGQTTPPGLPFTAGALTAVTAVPYVWLT